MKLYEGRNNEIRRVMRKFSLRVNRLIRTNYGPYSLGLVPNPHDLQEVPVEKQIKKLMFHYYKERAMSANAVLGEKAAEARQIEYKKKDKDGKKFEEEYDEEGAGRIGDGFNSIVGL